MDKLNDIVEKSLALAEKAMQAEGSIRPKVVIFFRDLNNDLGTYMVDLAPQKYFDSRLDIMEKVGKTLKKFQKENKGIRTIDIGVAYGEATVTIEGKSKPVVMASALDSKGNTVTRFKEVRHYMMSGHPEKTFFELQDLEIKGLKYKSPSLTQLFDNFTL